MALSVKLPEDVPWSNSLWEKLVKVVICFSTFLVNLSLEKRNWGGGRGNWYAVF